MNPLTNVKNIIKLNERELSLGVDQKNSWHNMYSSSAWIFVGGLNYDLSEGDVITVFSQYGEVVNINLIRDQKTGKSKGFCFLCYEDQRSTVLAVDNLNGIKLLNRIIRVDHVQEYKIPKEHEDMDELTKRLHEEGCAPKETLIKEETEDSKHTKDRHSKRNGKRHKNRRRSSSSDSSSSSSSSSSSDSRLKSRQKLKRSDKRDDTKRNDHKSGERDQSYSKRKTDKSRHSKDRTDKKRTDSKNKSNKR